MRRTALAQWILLLSLAGCSRRRLPRHAPRRRSVRPRRLPPPKPPLPAPRRVLPRRLPRARPRQHPRGLHCRRRSTRRSPCASARSPVSPTRASTSVSSAATTASWASTYNSRRSPIPTPSARRSPPTNSKWAASGSTLTPSRWRPAGSASRWWPTRARFGRASATRDYSPARTSTRAGSSAPRPTCAAGPSPSCRRATRPTRGSSGCLRAAGSRATTSSSS